MSKTIIDKLDLLQADHKTATDTQAIINNDWIKKLDAIIDKMKDSNAKKSKPVETETKTTEAAPVKGFAINSMNWFQREFAKDKNIVNKYLNDELKKDYEKRINEEPGMKELTGTKRHAAECKLFWGTYCKANSSTKVASILAAITNDYKTAKEQHESAEAEKK